MRTCCGTRCEELCAATEGCDSIDMHEYLPRCYLNTKECDAEQDNLGAVPRGVMMELQRKRSNEHFLVRMQ